MKYRQGFTLLELMITIAIMAILVAIATPSMRTLIQKNQVASQMRDLSSFLQEVRGKAVLERRPYNITIESSPAGNTGSGSNIANATATWSSNGERVQLTTTTSSFSINLLGAIDVKEACFVIHHVNNNQIAQVLIVNQNGNAKIYTDKTACS